MIALPLRPIKRAVSDRGLLRSSAIVFACDAGARALGFLFAVAAARLLTPAGYGQIAYALAAVAIVTVLTNNAPQGLGRFLARHEGDRRRQQLYATNWLVVIAMMLGISLVLVIPVAIWGGLGGAMLIGLMANLVGTAVFQSYRESQKGLGRFWATGGFWMLANLIQLVAILVVGALGWRSPALFLTIYGLSSLAALALMSPFVPSALTFSRTAVALRQVVAIARFVWPLILTGVFYNVWLWADLILAQHLLHHHLIANYAAAKTLVAALTLPVTAINFALGARMARLAESELRAYILGVLLLAGAIIVPLCLGLALVGEPLIGIVFGSRYLVASQIFVILVLGQGLFAFTGVLQAVWIWGLSRPGIDPVSTGAGMVVTVTLGLLLIPAAGFVGAAWAYAAGAAAQLAVLAAFTGWAIYAGAHPRLPPRRELTLELEQAVQA
jgi:O-antigen/teichoic acid export membrane protein